MNIFTKFLKPKVVAKLVSGGSQVKIKFINIDKEQIVIVLFSLITKVASIIGIPHRELVNRLIALDKTIVKEKNKLKKKKKYNK